MVSQPEPITIDSQFLANLPIANWEPKDPANQALQQYVKTPHELFNEVLSKFGDGNTKPGDQQIAELIDFIEGFFKTTQSQHDRISSETRRACIEFIHSLAELEIGYGSSSDKAWEILKTQIEDRSELSGVSPEPNSDMFKIAYNRTCTYALYTLLVFSKYEYNKFATCRPGTLRILKECLKLTGQNGIEFRAIIAPSLNFLEHLAPEWLENSRDCLLGEKAPEGLAQKTVDLAFKWGQPSDWLLKNFREMIEDSVTRYIPGSLAHYLEGMLRGHEGYSVREVVDFLKQIPSQTTNIVVPGDPWQGETTAISYAGEQLARLLRTASESQIHDRLEIADLFWKTVLALEEPRHLKGFGWFSKVISMDDTLWAERTLETLRLTDGHIKCPHQVAERALQLDDKKSGFEILNHLIRGEILLNKISQY